MHNIDEDSYLDDAIVFHQRLNPAIWADGDMKPEVREALLAMAAEFQDFLGLDELDLVDITVSGSNAAYTYTPHSDIDLHLVVKTPKAQEQLYAELFDAKKNLYNLTHDQKIKGFDVEFYVQNVNNPVNSIGIYSVLHGKWESVPKRIRAEIDDLSVLSRVDSFTHRINTVLQGEDLEQTQAMWDDLKNMRKAGLEAGGEFSPENLAFKILRTRGYQQRLFDRILELKDKQLSLEGLNEQQLNELFNSKVDYTVLAKRRNYFKTEAEINGRVIQFEAAVATDRSFPYWEIDFRELKDGKTRYDATGSGGEKEVFSMVIASLNELIDSYSPDTIMFSAMKGGAGSARANIYTKIVKRYLSDRYEAEEMDSSAKRLFLLKKKQ